MPKEQQVEHQSAEEFLNAMLHTAVGMHVSDIHIEPLKREFRIRFRVDGTLQEQWRKPLHELDALLNRIKVLANLDLVMHGMTQEGHFEAMITPNASPADDGAKATTSPSEQMGAQHLSDKLSSLLFGGEKNTAEKQSAPAMDQSKNEPSAKKEQRLLNVRVSIFPTLNGSTAVLRVLNREDLLKRLSDLEMDDDMARSYKRLISKIYGLVLITGPSGSGKTTTLYATLQELQSPEKNIITLEDPVEFHFEEFRQTQILADRGFTFAVAMRSILRQDPDALMIGEIRDPETAEYAMRAALIGRIIISTVHSNTTIGTIARLIDMKIERSLIAYALNGVMARRLVRRVCESCKIEYTPAPEYLAYFETELKGHRFIKGTGCAECRGSGYRGRVGLFEILEIDNNFRTLVVEQASMDALQQYVEKTGMKTLKQDGLEKVRAGLTTLEEIVKAV